MNRISVVKYPSPALSQNRVEWTRDAFNHWIDDGHVVLKCCAAYEARENLKLQCERNLIGIKTIDKTLFIIIFIEK